MDVDIQEMTPSHIDEVLGFWRGMDGIGLDEVADSREGIKKYLSRNPGLSFVARIDDRIVGAVLCGHDGRRAYLHHLAVTRRHRRCGIGRGLVERCVCALQEAGIRRCHLFVFDGSTAAKAFWIAMGWQRPESFSIMSRTIIGCDDDPC